MYYLYTVKKINFLQKERKILRVFCTNIFMIYLNMILIRETLDSLFSFMQANYQNITKIQKLSIKFIREVF